MKDFKFKIRVHEASNDEEMLENVLMRQMVLSAAAVGTCAAEKDAMHLTLKRIMMERPSDGQTASTPLLQSVRALVIV